MMTIYDAVLITGLLLVCCAGFGVGLFALRRPVSTNDTAQAAQSDTIAVMDQIATMQERLDKLGNGMRRIANSVEQLQMTRQPANDFDHATALARNGASAEQLIEQCGITRGEAELLRRLNENRCAS